MADILTLPSRNYLVCDDCGCSDMRLWYDRDDDTFLITAIECANCGKTIRFTEDEAEIA